MTIDLAAVEAIDVHVHAEIGRAGEDGLKPEWRRAAVGYFGEHALPTVDDVAAYYRERKLAAVVFTVDAETLTGRAAVPNEEISEAAAANADVLIPFASADPNKGARGVEEARRETPFVIVDFHGEATSEKVAMAWHLDGRVTAVFGTHTHIQTNDARVLPGGTAAITDAGMTGPHESVIGVKSELAIKRMLTGMPVRFETAEGDVRIEGVLLETDGSGKATRCETFRVSVE